MSGEFDVGGAELSRVEHQAAAMLLIVMDSVSVREEFRHATGLAEAKGEVEVEGPGEPRRQTADLADLAAREGEIASIAIVPASLPRGQFRVVVVPRSGERLRVPVPAGRRLLRQRAYAEVLRVFAMALDVSGDERG